MVKVPAQSKKQFVTILFFVMGLILTIGVVVWGRSDTGVINVSATIANSNQIAREEGRPNDEAPQAAPEAFTNMVNGGLVAQDPSLQPTSTIEPTPVVEATTTATSTTEAVVEVATSTDAFVDTSLNTESSDTVSVNDEVPSQGE